MTAPLIIETVSDLRAQIWAWRGAGESIGFVPTMGALHKGHFSLLAKADKHASKTVVSIYVNPAQFSASEDLSAYPCRETQDVEALAAAGCDLVYIPKPGEIYAPNHATHITMAGPALGLESDHRPDFLGGVALVVAKLLNQVAPDMAVFGEKDYQQLACVRALVRDLDMPVRILSAPIVRQKDGLALSSRNAYFGVDDRKIAGALNRQMLLCAAQISQGQEIEAASRSAGENLLKAGFSKIDYISAVDPRTLEVLTNKLAARPARLLLAAHLAGVRLIDNCKI